MAPPKQPKRIRSDEEHSDGNNEKDDGEIKDLLRSMSTKIDSLCGTLTDVDNRLNGKIDGLELSLCKMIGDAKEDMDLKLSSFSADVDLRLQSVIDSSNRKCEATAAQVSTAVSNRIDEMSAMYEFRLDKLERISLEKELIITGVPMEPNDNPLGLVGDIVTALNCNLQQHDFTAAFRLKRNGAASGRSVPIIVRVYDNQVKQSLMSCYFKRKNLNLKDIGFKTSTRIFINESLTKANREIFNLASEAKRAFHIVKLFTRNGLVHVQRCDNEKPICIKHISDLEQILPPTFGRIPSNNIPFNRRWSSLNSNSTADKSTKNSAGSTTPHISEHSSTHPGNSLVPPNLS